MVKAYPVSNPTVPPYERFSLTLWPDGICQLQPHLPLSGALVETIIAEVSQLVEREAGVRGFLLDMRGSTPLSIVRLSELIERLGTLDLPTAVLFSEARHYQTAILLHNTLVRQRRVAYFTDLEQARAFLHTPTDSNHTSQTDPG